MRVQRATVQQQCVFGVAVQRGELIHDAAAGADELILRALAELRDRGGVHGMFRKAKESQGCGDFQSGGGAQSGADGDLSIDQKICAGDIEAFIFQLNENAAYVIGPVVRGLRFRFMDGEGCGLWILQRLDR